MRKESGSWLLLVGATILSLLLAEILGLVYVYKFEERGRLFRTDPELGWSVKPNLSLYRRNSDGDYWLIKTDDNGFRIIDTEQEAATPHVVIMGDSFAFGEGVNVEERFDTEFINRGFSDINTGVMGYGTGQQYLVAQPYVDALSKGDFLVVLTYFNDFYDLSLNQHSGRAKPRFDYYNGKLVFHPADVGFSEILRDASYVYAMLNRLLSNNIGTRTINISAAAHVYGSLLQLLEEQAEHRGFLILLAYHGMQNLKQDRPEVLSTIGRVCDGGAVYCVDLDEKINNSEDNLFLKDGHWNRAGHELVGKSLVKALESAPL